MLLILLIVVLILLFGGGFGYYSHTNWGPNYGAPVGIGTILLIILVLYLLGVFRR